MMFDNDRYISKGINENLTDELINFMFVLIDDLKNKVDEVDYLQVFKISRRMNNDEGNYLIEHTQEIPEYKAMYGIKISDTLPRDEYKVFVIDEHTDSYKGYTTMILAEEY